MQDKFEKYVEEHRPEFDRFEPPLRSWQVVQSGLQKRRKFEPRRYVAVAAAVLFILSAFIWFVQWPAQPKPVAQQGTGTQARPEIRAAEAYYTTLVEASRTQIDKYRQQYPDLCKDFEKEIDTLSSMYGNLKTEYTNSAGNEAVLQAMIENLQIQVDILKRQLQVLSAIKQQENKNSAKLI